MNPEEQPRFSVEASTDGRFRVLNDAGRVVVTCRDRHSADEYAVLLHEAWQRGFKAGFRAGRERARS